MVEINGKEYDEDYIEWIDNKLFLLQTKPEELSSKGYVYENFDWLGKPLVDYDSILFYRKEDKNSTSGYIVLAKRIRTGL